MNKLICNKCGTEKEFCCERCKHKVFTMIKNDKRKLAKNKKKDRS